MLKQKVVIAMSGGVDSSVAAYLLKRDGYEVIGMMMRLWSEPGKENSNRCCTPDSVAQARKVAAYLEIPFYVLDAKQIFYDKVVTGFLEGYKSGITPNPCLNCNRWIRFDHLYKHAQAFGADYFSTGHYVQKVVHSSGLPTLKRALDERKDQSYVLHVLPSRILPNLLFPIGQYTKDEIRSIALEIGLSVAKRPDSQDLCFLAGGDYRDFLKRHNVLNDIPGNIIDASTQEVISKHNGLSNFTIGQRKGLGFSSEQPYYVIEKNFKDNSLLVGPKNALGYYRATVENPNWLIPPEFLTSAKVMVKSRYTARLVSAEILPTSGKDIFDIVFQDSQRDLTPGQAAVIYQDDLLFGGGVIKSTSRE